LNSIEIPKKKTSLDVLCEATKYSLDIEWDLFKHYDSKASTLLAGSTTILSIFIGIQFFIVNLIDRPETLFSPIFYAYLFTLGIIIFYLIVTARFLMGAVWSALECLNEVEFKRVPNPARLKEVFFDKTDFDTKISILREMIESWLKNHDIFNVKKAQAIKKSFRNIKLGILFLIASISVNGMLLTLYELFLG
jgi:hypothetical protein